VALFIAMRSDRRRIAVAALATFVPAAVLYALLRPVLAAGEAGGLCPSAVSVSVTDAALRHGFFAMLRSAAPIAVQTLGTLFFWSDQMRLYWNNFSWGGYAITFGSAEFTRITTFAIRYLTLGAAVLVLARIVIDGQRLVRIAWRGRARRALLVLARRTTFLTYVAFIAIVCGLVVYAGGDFALQGRYFLPVIEATFLCAVVWGPSVLPKRAGKVAGGFLLSALVLYGLGGAYFGYRSVYQRFYSSPPAQAPVDIWARFDDAAGRMQLGPTANFGLVRGRALRLSGFAFDGRSLDPWAGVALVTDGAREVRAGYGLSRPDVACRETDSGLAGTGFTATLDTSLMKAGTHTVALVALTRTGQTIPTDARAVFTLGLTRALSAAPRGRRAERHVLPGRPGRAGLGRQHAGGRGGRARQPRVWVRGRHGPRAFIGARKIDARVHATPARRGVELGIARERMAPEVQHGRVEKQRHQERAGERPGREGRAPRDRDGRAERAERNERHRIVRAGLIERIRAILRQEEFG
jgi:hypothetical protein